MKLLSTMMLALSLAVVIGTATARNVNQAHRPRLTPPTEEEPNKNPNIKNQIGAPENERVKQISISINSAKSSGPTKVSRSATGDASLFDDADFRAAQEKIRLQFPQLGF